MEPSLLKMSSCVQPPYWMVTGGIIGLGDSGISIHSLISFGDRGRFMDIVRSVAGKRLTYNKLIDLDGKTSGGLPPQTAGAW